MDRIAHKNPIYKKIKLKQKKEKEKTKKTKRRKMRTKKNRNINKCKVLIRVHLIYKRINRLNNSKIKFKKVNSF